MKSFSLILMILGLSYMTVSANRECQVTFYGPTPSPVCETYIDENGQEQEQCYQLGSAAAALLLNKTNKSYSDATYSGVEYMFSGTCNCILQLWPLNNFNGIPKSYAINKLMNRHIIVEKSWKKVPKSFKVACKF